jgi:adenine-specific DNA-methyltransferase
MKNYNQSVGDLGQHWTPVDVVSKMISLMKNKGSILEPCAGSGRFVEQLPNCKAVEIDETVVPENLKKQYIIQNFFDYPISNKFDTLIGNPPYVAGRLLTPDWLSSWKGILPRTANAYLHFIEKSIEHLTDNGELIFIVPVNVLSDTSRGKELRSKMAKMGAFTDIIFSRSQINRSDVSWETASVDTLIFRWQKNLKQGKVNTNVGVKELFERNGFIWLIEFEPKATIGDYFRATVGSAPYKKDIAAGERSDNFGEYVKEGKLVKVCEKYIDTWRRSHDTPKTDKIFFVGRQIRRWPIFSAGDNPKHIDWALMPKLKIDTKKSADALNIWFKKNGVMLGVIRNGRWKMGVKQIESCPMDKELFDLLESFRYKS